MKNNFIFPCTRDDFLVVSVAEPYTGYTWVNICWWCTGDWSQVTGVKQEGTVSQVRHHRSDDGENHGEVIPGVIVTVTRMKWSLWCFSYFSAIQQLQLLEMYKEKLQIELLSKASQWRKQLLEDYQMFLFLRLKRILYERADVVCHLIQFGSILSANRKENVTNKKIIEWGQMKTWVVCLLGKHLSTPAPSFHCSTLYLPSISETINLSQISRDR